MIDAAIIRILGIIAAGTGKVTLDRESKPVVWVIDGSSEVIAPNVVGAFFTNRLLTSTRRSGRAAITDRGRRVLLDAIHTGAPPLGSTIDYRGDRCGRGRVIAATGLQATVVPAIQKDAVPVIVEVRRPHARAPWKRVSATAVGYYAPGGYGAARGLWAAITAIPGLLPARWHEPDVGAPHTLARLRSVCARIMSIGSRGSNVEERAANRLWSIHSMRLDIAGMRGTVEWMGAATHPSDRDEPVAAYIEAVITGPDAAEIEAAEVIVAVDRIGRMFDHFRGPVLSWPIGDDGRRRPPADLTLPEVLSKLHPKPSRRTERIYTEAFAIVQKRIADWAAILAAQRAAT